MSTPEIDPGLRTKVASLKAADFLWRKRMNQTLAVGLIPGVVVGVGTWFSQEPIDRDANMFWGVVGLGLVIWFFGCMLTRMRFHRPELKCPKCGNDWTSSEEYPINMLTWKCCPGCGLNVSDDADSHDKPDD